MVLNQIKYTINNTINKLTMKHISETITDFKRVNSKAYTKPKEKNFNQLDLFRLQLSARISNNQMGRIKRKLQKLVEYVEDPKHSQDDTSKHYRSDGETLDDVIQEIKQLIKIK